MKRYIQGKNLPQKGLQGIVVYLHDAMQVKRFWKKP